VEKEIFQYLLEQGVAREAINQVFAPMGLNIATVKPKEIALSILSEILLVKNGGSTEHMREVKNISY
jgi:xanthine dehydrogenase accessory factor